MSLKQFQVIWQPYLETKWQNAITQIVIHCRNILHLHEIVFTLVLFAIKHLVHGGR